jgi:hypothetical protein
MLTHYKLVILRETKLQKYFQNTKSTIIIYETIDILPEIISNMATLQISVSKILDNLHILTVLSVQHTIDG